MNQNLKQLARDKADEQFLLSVWIIHYPKSIDLQVESGVTLWYYLADVCLADYFLYLDIKPVGMIKAKSIEEVFHFSLHENQFNQYDGNTLNCFESASIIFFCGGINTLNRIR